MIVKKSEYHINDKLVICNIEVFVISNNQIKYIKFKFGKVNLKFRKDYFKYFLILLVLFFVALPYADLSFPKHFLSN